MEGRKTIGDGFSLYGKRSTRSIRRSILDLVRYIRRDFLLAYFSPRERGASGLIYLTVPLLRPLIDDRAPTLDPRHRSLVPRILPLLWPMISFLFLFFSFLFRGRERERLFFTKMNDSMKRWRSVEDRSNDETDENSNEIYIYMYTGRENFCILPFSLSFPRTFSRISREYLKIRTGGSNSQMARFHHFREIIRRKLWRDPSNTSSSLRRRDKKKRKIRDGKEKEEIDSMIDRFPKKDERVSAR